METKSIQAIYLPVSYNPNIGAVELQCIEEGYKLLELEVSDIISMTLPQMTIYMSRRYQRDREDALLNRGASLVVKTAGLPDVGIWGPILVVKKTL